MPPEGEEIADPIVGFYRVGYDSGAEGIFVPITGRWELDVHGTDGRAWGWEQQGVWRVRRGGGKPTRGRRSSPVEETEFHP